MAESTGEDVEDGEETQPGLESWIVVLRGGGGSARRQGSSKLLSRDV